MSVVKFRRTFVVESRGLTAILHLAFLVGLIMSNVGIHDFKCILWPRLPGVVRAQPYDSAQFLWIRTFAEKLHTLCGCVGTVQGTCSSVPYTTAPCDIMQTHVVERHGSRRYPNERQVVWERKSNENAKTANG